MLDSSKLVIEYIFCELNTSFFDGGKPCFYRKQPVFTAKEKKRKEKKRKERDQRNHWKHQQPGLNQRPPKLEHHSPHRSKEACTGRN